MNEQGATGEQRPTIWVAIYARKSGDENLNGVVTSIESQVAACRSYIEIQKEKGWQPWPDFHLARVRKGLWCGGLPPLGYDSKDKRFVINEAEARLVKRVFELYLEHRAAARVADELNRLGFRRKLYQTVKGRLYGGQRFDEDSVLRILQRKVYAGKITNERTGLEFPGQQYSVNKFGFTLKGLARCGKCGSALVGYVRPKKNKVYRYYRCMAVVDGAPVSCDFMSIIAERLEAPPRRCLGPIAGLLGRRGLPRPWPRSSTPCSWPAT